MAWRLARRFEYDGLEPDPASFAVASNRLSDLDRGRIRPLTTDSPQVTGPYDLICAFEVLEHLPDDRAELVRWKGLLRPGGHALLSVPAHRDRYGAADAAVGHCRRYNRDDLEKVLSKAGFELVTIEAWGMGLGHVLEWVRHRFAERTESGEGMEGAARSGRWLQPRGRMAGALAALVAAPFRVLQHPFRSGERGIGWVALACNPE